VLEDARMEAPAVAPRTNRLHSVEEAPLPYREQRLERALARLGPLEAALLVDTDGLLVAALGHTHDHEALAALAVHPTLVSDKLGALLGEVRGFAFTLANGRVLEVRPVDDQGLQLVTVARTPLDPTRSDRVARELRLLLA